MVNASRISKVIRQVVNLPHFSRLNKQESMKFDPTILEESYRRCQRISRRAGSNFYAGFALLPRPKRRAMHALYAFLRYADDTADTAEGPDVGEARQKKFDLLRLQLDEVIVKNHPEFSHETADGIFPALADTVERYQIPRECLFEALAGMEMDLHKNHYATFDELRQYCERVASAVGVACLHIWGFRRRGTPEATSVLDLARQVGIALQLTNILRDLREDAIAGRVYVPEEDFLASGYMVADLLQGKANLGFKRLMRRVIDRAQTHYQAANALYLEILPEGRRIFGLMVATYHALLKKIDQHPTDVLQRRMVLSRCQRLLLAVRWSCLPCKIGSLNFIKK
jgi:15-cis-phytoene synthase